MFTVNAEVKLIDFGLCRDGMCVCTLARVRMHMLHAAVSRARGCTMLGSPYWMPPEMVLYEPHCEPADIWSFAIRCDDDDAVDCVVMLLLHAACSRWRMASRPITRRLCARCF
jgi:serine/threonine protein kinase